MIFNSYYSFIKQPSNDTMKSSRSFHVSMCLGRQIPFLGFYETSIFCSFIYIYIFFFFPFHSLEFSHLFPDFSTSVQYLVPQIFI